MAYHKFSYKKPEIIRISVLQVGMHAPHVMPALQLLSFVFYLRLFSIFTDI